MALATKRRRGRTSLPARGSGLHHLEGRRRTNERESRPKFCRTLDGCGSASAQGCASGSINNYEKDVYNGDIGRIISIDPFEQKNLAATNPAELKCMMQGLIAGLEKQNAVYPVDEDTKSPLKPKLP